MVCFFVSFASFPIEFLIKPSPAPIASIQTSQKEILSRERAAKGARALEQDEHVQAASEDVIYKIEIPANRYDLLCEEGLVRSLKIFTGQIESPPVYRVKNPAAEDLLTMHVKSDVRCCPLRVTNVLLLQRHTHGTDSDILHPTRNRRPRFVPLSSALFCAGSNSPRTHMTASSTCRTSYTTTFAAVVRSLPLERMISTPSRPPSVTRPSRHRRLSLCRWDRRKQSDPTPS